MIPCPSCNAACVNYQRAATEFAEARLAFERSIGDEEIRERKRVLVDAEFAFVEARRERARALSLDAERSAAA